MSGGERGTGTGVRSRGRSRGRDRGRSRGGKGGSGGSRDGPVLVRGSCLLYWWMVQCLLGGSLTQVTRSSCGCRAGGHRGWGLRVRGQRGGWTSFYGGGGSCLSLSLTRGASSTPLLSPSSTSSFSSFLPCFQWLACFCW